MFWIKKIFGMVIMLLAVAIVYLVIKQAIIELSNDPSRDELVFWPVILPVFLPVMAGMLIFGFYAWKGEYSTLPEKSDDLND